MPPSADLIPAAVRDALAVRPEPGQWYPIHSLVTCGTAEPAVCLLSSIELRAGRTTISVASYSSRAARNLADNPWATLACWADGIVTLTLQLRDGVERDGVYGYLFDVRRSRNDDIGIPMRPLVYQATDSLPQLERWDVSLALLDDLDALADHGTARQQQE